MTGRALATLPEMLPETLGNRAERVVAGGRLVLAAFTLLAIWLDPSQPSRYADQTYLMMLAYVLYAALIAILVRQSHWPLKRFAIVTHLGDVVIFSVFLYLTEGPSSPLFSYYTFSLVSATLRWRWHGTLWTALAILLIYNSMGIYAHWALHDPSFELNRFIIRSVYLAVVTFLLAYLGAHELRQRSELAGLAAWPRDVPGDIEALLDGDLAAAAAILKAPRILLVWPDPDEAELRIGLWANGKLETRTEPGVQIGALVHEDLAAWPFYTNNAASRWPLVWYRAGPGLVAWNGEPVPAALRTRFDMDRLVCVPVRSMPSGGRLFALDRRRQVAEDLIVAEVVARQLGASLDHFCLSRRLRRATPPGAVTA